MFVMGIGFESVSDKILELFRQCDIFVAFCFNLLTGIPSAFLSIDTVNHLCQLLLKPVEQVRGCAAIALGYLSFNHTGERQILNRYTFII